MSEEEDFDVIVVGGGPAGLNTAIMCASRHLKVLLLEGNKMGGLLATLYPNKTIPNYPGFPEGIVAIKLVRSWLHHLKSTGVVFKSEMVARVERDLTVTSTRTEYKSHVVVLATGTKPRRLGILHEEEFSRESKGVYYFASHPEEFLGKRVIVVGGGDTAIDATLELLDLASEVTLIHRHEGFRAFDQNVERVRRSGIVNVLPNAELLAMEGNGRVEKVIVKQRGEKLEKQVDAVIIAIGLVPNDQIFSHLPLKTNPQGFLLTDRAQRTNVEGIFAVGDVTNVGLRLITVAAGHGAIASHHIYSFIRRPYWTRETWPTSM
ncbi:MAG: NAD(P)/FAD-dependent oxidoreductase [Candidatus Bathyarchaeota archaeon]|nr:MAG: NAD(P)/FAD-dependent oxidoreductase [Candidatus Bathyarchaeota archaeon]